MSAAAAARSIECLQWPADAQFALPTGKSEINRLLIAAALGGSPLRIRDACPGDDVRHLTEALLRLGFAVRFDEAAGAIDVGPRAANAPTTATLSCGNAGTALRFLVSLCALLPGDWTITGDAQMLRRPIGPLVHAWRQLGVDATDANGCPPVHIRGGTARGSRVIVDASQSSQFVSSLLLVGAHLPEGLDITFAGPVASVEYVSLTRAALLPFGIEVQMRADGVRVLPGQRLCPREVQVSGDWSAMGVWTCLQFLTASQVQASNLRRGSAQADERLAEVLQQFSGSGERTIDVGSMPDQFLNLAVTAALRPGTTRIAGAANLRLKECDRIAVMTRELTRCGARVDELPDGIIVHGGSTLHGTAIDPERDHRVAMAFALLGLIVPGVSVIDPDCVTKSYPTFWRDLDSLRTTLRCISVIGMRAAGKSTFARALAQATGATWIDTDESFVREHGPIEAFVAAHGWPAFRAAESHIVATSLRPGHIVSTGGGAIEDPSTRDRLRTASIPIWIEGTADLLRSRLANGAARPSLTGQSVVDEVPVVLARRAPLYQDLAALRLDASLPTGEQVVMARRLLAAPCRFPGTPHAPR